MSKRLRSLIPCLAAMAAILAIGLATPAHAGLDIDISTDGTTFVPVATGTDAGPVIYPGGGTYNNIAVSVLTGQSNSPGTAALAKLLGATVQLSNTTSGPNTVWISVGTTDFSSPTTPPPIAVNSHIGGSYGGTAAIQFQSWIDSTNTQNSLSGLTPGLQTPALASGSFQNDAFLTINSLGSPYSVTEYFKVTLTGSTSFLNFSANTALTPLPEPSTMALVGVGAMGLIGYGLRRRKAMGA